MSTNSSLLQTPPWPSLYDPFIDLLRIPHNAPVSSKGHYLIHPNDIFRFTFYWTLIFYLPLSVLAGTYASLNIAFPPKSRHTTTFGRGDAEHLESHPLVPLSAASHSHSPSPASATFPPQASPKPSGTAFAPKAGSIPSSSSARPSPSTAVPTSVSVSVSVSITVLASSPSPGPAPAPAATFSPTPASPSTPTPASRRTPQKVNPHRTRAVYALVVLFVYLCCGLIGAVVGSAIVGYVLAALYQAGGFFMSTWIPPLFALVQTLIGVLGIYPSIAEII